MGDSIQSLLDVAPEAWQLDLLQPLRGLVTVIESNYPNCSDSSVKALQQLVTLCNTPGHVLSLLEKQQILSHLSQLLVTPSFTFHIVHLFRPLLLELTIRATRAAHTSPVQLIDMTNLCSCLSRLLFVAPQISPIVLEFLRRSPSIFDSLSSVEATGSVKFTPIIELLATAERFLQFSHRDYSALWNWAPVYTLLSHSNAEVRASAFSCVTRLLGLTSAGISCNMLAQTSDEVVLQHAKRMASEQRLYAVEQSLMYIDSVAGRVGVGAATLTSAELDDTLVDVCGILLPRRKSQRHESGAAHGRHRLVATPTSKQNLHALALAVCLGRPILLEGVPGAGKTALIDELAWQTGNHDVVKIHLGDQTDGKALLGTYVCTEQPGQFRWQRGALTAAVQEGRWVVIEDIELAPLDILSVLLPLLEARKLFIPGRDETVYAAAGFQLFATQTLLGAARGPHLALLGSLCTRVVVEPLGPAELAAVIRHKYPSLAGVAGRFIDTFGLLRRGEQPVSVEAVASTDAYSGATNVVVASGRFLSTRDLFKWCSRVDALAHAAMLPAVPATLATGGDLPQGLLTSQFCEAAFQEAVDCFCAMIPRTAVRRRFIEAVAVCWGLPPDRLEYYVSLHKPPLSLSKDFLSVGRVALPTVPAHRMSTATAGRLRRRGPSRFAHTKHALRLLEKIAVSVRLNEPVLLVGETGTGKTSVVQYLADQLGQRLVVQNLNQQTDSADLLGGFKPVEMRVLCAPVKLSFEGLFRRTFSKTANSSFMDQVGLAYASQRWSRFIKLLKKAIAMVDAKWEKLHVPAESAAPAPPTQGRKTQRSNDTESAPSAAPRPPPSPTLREEWKQLSGLVSQLEHRLEQGSSNFAFAFVEGALVEAVRHGHWVLLDEINLASAELLESLSGLLEEGGGISLTERGDLEPVPRHPNFRLFACMNPSTDVGKKDLPPGLRNRFTEIYVDDLTDPEDLCTVVRSYVPSASKQCVEAVVEFYLAACREAATRLCDGSQHKPHYSLRTLVRALEAMRQLTDTYGASRALYESLSMSFITQLDGKSSVFMEELIQQYVKKATGEGQPHAKTGKKPAGDGHVQVEGFWLERGEQAVVVAEDYILTKTIRAHLRNLARILAAGRYPILLQGPTSSGKTSLVEYLARSTGHRFVRINNHEHTDIQEYLGSYVPAADGSGRLEFQEGVLVDAVRKGYWVVLDELNLAPSEVLEALNRLLDDHRELFIPETGETVVPHPHFALFATQNPPGLYGGRKVLSRAFRNRFLELHVDDIPDDELETILAKRCKIPPSWAKLLVAVMRELQRVRSASHVFAGKHGFITLRDLFRWAERRAATKQELATDGYMLLAERLRNDEEKVQVRSVLEQLLKVSIDVEGLYSMEPSPSSTDSGHMLLDRVLEQLKHQPELSRGMVWTKSMRRLFTLVGRCLEHGEPVLLVGETGTGKTSVCQLFASLLGRRLHIVNCHQHSEAADFLGGLRPVRGKDALRSSLLAMLAELVVCAEALPSLPADIVPSIAALSALLADGATALPDCLALVESTLAAALLNSSADTEDITQRRVRELIGSIREGSRQYQALFEWADGPLVQAMKEGDMFLADEISLAEDSVLERLNSVLEPQRVLVLAEKGGGGARGSLEEVVAHPDFRILATMNPGGDFGKRELSPAMRNRFTEIWVPAVDSLEDLGMILRGKLAAELGPFAERMLEFAMWFGRQLHRHAVLSIRDLLSWASFMNAAVESKRLTPFEAYLHGACLAVVDGIGLGTASLASERANNQLRADCHTFLLGQCPPELVDTLRAQFATLAAAPPSLPSASEWFGVAPFYIPRGPHPIPSDALAHYSLGAPTTARNTQRVLRGMQLAKPLLLEGSPGVGKTSLIMAIGKAAGHRVVRINLSEQTDMMDLLGSDLPVEGATQGGQFEWRDGVLLQAVKHGDWVLLDELNLASQSVLEGLNALLDHRATVYIPELQKSFSCPPSFRLFACQNPSQQGGGRKGLPRSFLNRFTKVYIDQLTADDLAFILSARYPHIAPSLLAKMVAFNDAVHRQTMVEGAFGRKGAPWEFNLRDVFRWCDLVSAAPPDRRDPTRFVDLVYRMRFRTAADRRALDDVCATVFGKPPRVERHPRYHITPSCLWIGDSMLPRAGGPPAGPPLLVLHGQLHVLEALMKCVEMNWLCIVTGPSAAGKTSLIRWLASATGHTLHEFAMNSSVDTTELLGSFEQLDLQRQRQRLLDALEEAVWAHSRAVVAGVAPNQLLDMCGLLGDVHNLWHLLSRRVQYTADSGAAHRGLFDDETSSLVHQLLDKLQQVSGVAEERIPRQQHAKTLLQEVRRLEQLARRGLGGGRFEWLDGVLLQAIAHGDWLLIDNVNFCNPTVLDRLNPLLEPGGELMVNERGMVNGHVMVVRPHPGFRLFMTMDPRHGEISRAMRNRGIELAIVEEDDRAGPRQDHSKLLNARGVRGGLLPSFMSAFHAALEAATALNAEMPLSVRDLLHWGALLVEQLQRGVSPHVALQIAMEHVYVRSRRNHQHQAEIRALFASHLAQYVQLRSGNVNSPPWQTGLIEPMLWPTLLTQLGDTLLMDSSSSMVGVHAALFQSLYLRNIAAVLHHHRESLPPEWVRQWLGSHPWHEVACVLSPDATARMLGLAAVQSASTLSLVHPLQSYTYSAPLHLKFAGRYIVEQTSVEALKDGAVERWLAVHLGLVPLERVDTPPLLEETHSVCRQVIHVVRKLAGHPLVAMVATARAALAAEAGERWVAHLPIDTACSGMVALRAQQFPHHWYTNVVRRMRLAISLLFQQFTEESAYLASVASSGRPSRALILQSYRAYIQPSTRQQRSNTAAGGAVPDEVVPLLFPFFKALDEWVDGLLCLPHPHELPASTLAHLESVIELRNEWWNILHTATPPPLDTCVIYWHWLVKAILGTEAVAHSRVSVHLNTVMEQIDRALGRHRGENIYTPLWKFEGWTAHGEPAGAVIALLDHLSSVGGLLSTTVERDWHNLLGTHDGGSVPPCTLPLLAHARVPEVLKQLLVQAYSSARWVLLADDAAAVQALLPSLVHVPQHLMDSLKATATALAARHRPLWEGGMAPCPDATDALRAARAAMAPLVDFMMERLEWAILSNLLRHLSFWLPDLLYATRTRSRGTGDTNSYHIATPSEVGRVLVESLQGEAGPLRQLLDTGLSDRSARPPLELVPYQLLDWLIASSPRTAPLPSAPAGEAFLLSLPGLLQEALLAWHRRAWTNPSQAVSSSPSDDLWASPAAFPIAGQGPCRYLLPFVSISSFRMLREVGRDEDGPPRAAISLSSYSSTLAQLQQLSELLRSPMLSGSLPESSPDSAALDWTNLFHAYAVVLGCYCLRFSPEDFRQLFQQLTSLRDHLLYAVGLSIAAPPRGPSSSPLPQWASIRELLERCRDTSLTTRWDAHTRLHQPLVEGFAARAQRPPHSCDGHARHIDGVQRGKLWVKLGLLRLSLLVPWTGVDPACKSAVRLQRVGELIGRIATEIAVRSKIEQLTTGSDTNETVSQLRAELAQLQQDELRFRRRLRVRPSPSPFPAFVADVQRFVGTVGHVDRVDGLVGRVEQWANAASGADSTLLRQVQLWVEQAGHFARSLGEQYGHTLADVVRPLQLAVYQQMHGMQSAAVHAAAIQPAAAPTQLMALATELLAFPTPLALSQLGQVFHSPALASESPVLFGRLVRTALARIAVHAIRHRGLTKATHRQVHAVLHAVVRAWEQLKDAEREKEQQEQALFVYKERIHTIETEEQRDARLLQEMFPDYHKEFEDLLAPCPSPMDISEEYAAPWATKKDSNSSDSVPAAHSLKKRKAQLEAVLWQCIRIVGPLIAQYGDGSTRPRVELGLTTDDLMGSFQQGYDAASIVVEEAEPPALLALGEDWDRRAVPAHMVALKLLHSQLTTLSDLSEELETRSKQTRKGRRRRGATEKAADEVPTIGGLISGKSTIGGSGTDEFNLYHEPHIGEARLLMEPLSQFMRKVEGLLEQWPDNSILQQLHQFGQRLQQLPLWSPLQRVLTGVELLLTKAQQWEAYASHAVSLEAEARGLSSLVSRWRKLELLAWARLLAAKEASYRRAACMWWPLLYGLLAYSADAPTTNVMAQLVDTVDRFIQQSNLGEFPARLDLLWCFYKLLSTDLALGTPSSTSAFLADPDNKRRFANMVYHLYRHYRHYLPRRDAAVAKARTAIEQQVREYGKIARWDDHNYHALRSTVEHAHKKWLKWLKQFDETLQEPFMALRQRADLESYGAPANSPLSAVPAEPPAALPDDVLVLLLNAPSPSAGDAEQRGRTLLGTAYVERDDKRDVPEATPVSLHAGVAATLMALSSSAAFLGTAAATPVPPSSASECAFPHSMAASKRAAKYQRWCSRWMGPVEQLSAAVLAGKLLDTDEPTTQAEPSGGRPPPATGAAAHALRGALMVDQLCTEVIGQSAELRQAGSGPEKRRALTVLLRALSDTYGLQYHQAKATSAAMKDVLAVMARSPPSPQWPDTGKGPLPAAVLWECADAYFHRGLDDVQMLRAAAETASRDLPPAHVQQALGYAEHLFSMAVLQREALATWFCEMARVRPFVEWQQECRDQPLPPQRSAAYWTARLHSVIVQWKHALADLSLIGSAVDTLLSQARDTVDAMERTLAPHMRHWPADLVEGLLQEASAVPWVGKPTVAVLHQLFSQLEPLCAMFAASQWATECATIPTLCATTQEALSSFRQSLFPWLTDMSLTTAAPPASAEVEEAARHCMAQLEACVVVVLACAQKLRRLLQEPSTESTENELALLLSRGDMARLHAHYLETTRAFGFGRIHAAIAQLNQSIGRLSETTPWGSDAAQRVFAALHGVAPLIHQHWLAAQWHTLQLLLFHKTICKSMHLFVSLFTRLFRLGFCGSTSQDSEEHGEAEEEGTFTDDVAGVGIGEGKGKKDVSDRIEHEEEVLETRDEDKEDEVGNEEENNPEEGLEMDHDFKGGDMFDVDRPQQDEEEEEEEDQEKQEEEDEINRQMGEVDNEEEEEALDEKLWNEEEEEDENLKEHIDRTNPIKDSEVQLDEDLMAKEDIEKGGEEENEAAEEAEREGAQQQQEVEEQEEQQLTDSDDEGEGEEGKQPPESAEPFDVEPEIDDALMLSDEEEEEEKEKNKEGEDEPANVDSEHEGMEEEEEQQQQEEAKEQEEESMDGEQPQDPMDIGDDENEALREQDKASAALQEDNDEKQQPPEEEEEEEAHPEDKLSVDVPGLAYNEQQQQQHALPGASDGSRGHHARDSSARAAEPAENLPENASEQRDSTDTGGEDASVNAHSLDNGQWQHANVHPNEANAPQHSAPRFDPNPFRSLGDAVQQWKKRLALVSKEEEERLGEREEAPQPHMNDQQRSDAYHFLSEKHQQQQGDAQTMGPATEAQAASRQAEKEQAADQKEGEEDLSMNQSPTESLPSAMELKERKTPTLGLPRFSANMAVSEDRQHEQSGSNKSESDSSLSQPDGAVQPQARSHGDELISSGTLRPQTAPQDDRLELRSQHPPVTPELLKRLREEAEAERAKSQGLLGSELALHAQVQWNLIASLTRDSSQELCEQLRLVLEPTLAAKLRGDYRTGKRINMRKVIPYIASQYKKDKIWLRRTQPSKRQYQVVVAIDDSESMSHNHAGQLACEAMATIAQALSRLEVGTLSILAFGSEVKELHPFDRPFSDQAGADVLSQFTFRQASTNITLLLETVLHVLDHARTTAAISTPTNQHLQIVFIISDARFTERDGIRRLIRDAAAKHVFLVFIVIDNPNKRDSILQLKTVSYPGGRLTFTRYIDQFPFPYYIVLRDLLSLPHILADALRQWFELVNQMAT